jgi:hypothetical protein
MGGIVHRPSLSTASSAKDQLFQVIQNGRRRGSDALDFF